MIAYHFPPIQGSSGVHRTVQFAKHLPEFGWEPLIVSVHPRAYPKIGKDWFGGLPESAIINRAFALDSARHLAIRNRYLSYTAIPDRWVSWWPQGVITCLQLIKKYKPSLIWSTFPVASAHLIALTVQRLTGLPWVADFRDPMIQEAQPEPGIIRNVYQWIEKMTIQQSSAAVFVSNTALTHYANNFPGKSSNYWQLVENGFDEDLFQCDDFVSEPSSCGQDDGLIKIVHSGILYSKGRNPLAFFEGLSSYLRKGGAPVEVTLRGAGLEIDIEKWIASFGLKGTVKVKPGISYTGAIKEMINADALLLFQGSEYNKQIPAKVYEYIRAGHPILALTDECGETAGLLKEWDGVYVSKITSPEDIENALFQVVNDIQTSKKPCRVQKEVSKLSRREGTLKLSKILDSLFE
jgi:hypothetical protein